MGRNFWVRLRLGELQPASGPCSSARAWLWGSHIRYQKCPSSMWNSDHLQCSLAFHILPRASTLATWCEEPIHWKRPWCWERLKAGGEGGDRGWDGWMVSLTQWTWVWTDSGRWWRTGKSGVLQSTGLQRVGHYWVVTTSPGVALKQTGPEAGAFLIGNLGQDHVPLGSSWRLCEDSGCGESTPKEPVSPGAPALPACLEGAPGCLGRTGWGWGWYGLQFLAHPLGDLPSNLLINLFSFTPYL